MLIFIQTWCFKFSSNCFNLFSLFPFLFFYHNHCYFLSMSLAFFHFSCVWMDYLIKSFPCFHKTRDITFRKLLFPLLTHLILSQNKKKASSIEEGWKLTKKNKPKHTFFNNSLLELHFYSFILCFFLWGET